MPRLSLNKEYKNKFGKLGNIIYFMTKVSVMICQISSTVSGLGSSTSQALN